MILYAAYSIFVTHVSKYLILVNSVFLLDRFLKDKEDFASSSWNTFLLRNGKGEHIMGDCTFINFCCIIT